MFPSLQFGLSEAASVPVSAVEFTAKSCALDAHCHQQGQFLLVARGLVTCEVAQGLWIVPPQCALWIPARVAHSMRGAGDLELYCAYVAGETRGDLPTECCVMSVSPLLRELVIEISRAPRDPAANEVDARLIAVMLDQLTASPRERLHLPLPHDPQLRPIAERLLADPSRRTSIPHWARCLGMSERTLCRRVAKETGMSFGRWRLQLQILLAVQRLSEGESIQGVAQALGYESSSAFVTRFRKTLGKPPARFLSERRRGFQPNTTG